MSERPALRVMRGAPTAEEVAALTAVLSTSGAAAEVEALPERGAWADSSYRMRRMTRPGPGGWRASGRL